MPRVVISELSALTRMQWTGRVLVDDGVKLNREMLDTITEQLYEDVDGGDYEQDPHFWEKGEACQSTRSEATYGQEEAGLVTHVMAAGPDGDLHFREVKDGADPVRELAALKDVLAKGGEPDEEGD